MSHRTTSTLEQKAGAPTLASPLPAALLATTGSVAHTRWMDEDVTGERLPASVMGLEARHRPSVHPHASSLGVYSGTCTCRSSP